MPGLVEKIANYLDIKKRLLAPFVLLLLCTFFITWGAGMQQSARFDLSKLFVAFTASLIAWWIIFVPNKPETFPRYFNYFILFVIAHTFITYLFFFPNELTFASVQEQLLEGGFVYLMESKGTKIARILFFMLFAYCVASFLKSKQQLTILALSYGASVLLSVAIGGYVFESQLGSEVRFGGGFLNPNYLGSSAFVAFFLNLIALTRRKLATWAKTGCIGFLLVANLAVFLSASRAVLAALFVSELIFVIFLPSLKRKLQYVVLILAITTSAFALTPSPFRKTLALRSYASRVINDRGSERLDVWRDYLKKSSVYLPAGVGLMRTTEVTRGSFTTPQPRGTHNHYFGVLVQLGPAGFLLFFSAMFQLWRQTFPSIGLLRKSPSSCALLGLVVGWAVMLMFRDFWQARDFWFSLGIWSACRSFTLDLANGKPDDQANHAGGLKEASTGGKHYERRFVY